MQWLGRRQHHLQRGAAQPGESGRRAGVPGGPERERGPAEGGAPCADAGAGLQRGVALVGRGLGRGQGGQDGERAHQRGRGPARGVGPRREARGTTTLKYSRRALQAFTRFDGVTYLYDNTNKKKVVSAPGIMVTVGRPCDSAPTPKLARARANCVAGARRPHTLTVCASPPFPCPKHLQEPPRSAQPPRNDNVKAPCSQPAVPTPTLACP